MLLGSPHPSPLAILARAVGGWSPIKSRGPQVSHPCSTHSSYVPLIWDILIRQFQLIYSLFTSYHSSPHCQQCFPYGHAEQLLELFSCWLLRLLHILNPWWFPHSEQHNKESAWHFQISFKSDFCVSAAWTIKLSWMCIGSFTRFHMDFTMDVSAFYETSGHQAAAGSKQFAL